MWKMERKNDVEILLLEGKSKSDLESSGLKASKRRIAMSVPSLERSAGKAKEKRKFAEAKNIRYYTSLENFQHQSAERVQFSSDSIREESIEAWKFVERRKSDVSSSDEDRS